MLEHIYNKNVKNKNNIKIRTVKIIVHFFLCDFSNSEGIYASIYEVDIHYLRSINLISHSFSFVGTLVMIELVVPRPTLQYLLFNGYNSPQKTKKSA